MQWKFLVARGKPGGFAGSACGVRCRSTRVNPSPALPLSGERETLDEWGSPLPRGDRGVWRRAVAGAHARRAPNPSPALPLSGEGDVVLCVRSPSTVLPLSGEGGVALCVGSHSTALPSSGEGGVALCVGSHSTALPSSGEGDTVLRVGSLPPALALLWERAATRPARFPPAKGGQGGLAEGGCGCTRSTLAKPLPCPPHVRGWRDARRLRCPTITASLPTLRRLRR